MVEPKLWKCIFQDMYNGSNVFILVLAEQWKRVLWGSKHWNCTYNMLGARTAQSV